MAAQWKDALIADFDARYDRLLAARRSGDPVEVEAATAAIPSLSDPDVLRSLERLRSDFPRDYERLARTHLRSEEVVAEARRRRVKRRQVTQRAKDRIVRAERTVELPTTCARCGGRLDSPKTTGRPRVYCSPACRQAAYEDRRAHRDGAVKVQVVERVVTEVRERRIDVPHPRSECVQSVLDDDTALARTVWMLIYLVRDLDEDGFGTDTARFWDLYNNVEVLHEAIVKRATTDPRGQPDTRQRHRIRHHRPADHDATHQQS
jgi:hypothetical protein